MQLISPFSPYTIGKMHITRSMKIVVTMLISAAVLVLLLFFPFHIPYYRDWYNDAILDSYDHWLPCSQLPTVQHIEAVMTQNQDVLRQLGNVDPTGLPGIWITVENVCEDRGDILIEYGGRHHREQIEAILGDQTFFGIPVRLRNV